MTIRFGTKYGEIMFSWEHALMDTILVEARRNITRKCLDDACAPLTQNHDTGVARFDCKDARKTPKMRTMFLRRSGATKFERVVVKK